MHLGEEDAAYPPIDFSQVSYEGGMGGNLGYYEENTTDTQELEADHLNQDDFLHQIADIQEVEAGQPNQVEPVLLDAPAVWRVVGVLLSVVITDEDDEEGPLYDMKIVREYIKPGWVSVLSLTNEVLGYITGIQNIVDDDGVAFGFEEHGRELIVPLYSSPEDSVAITPTGLEERTCNGLKRLGTLNVDFCPAPLFVTGPDQRPGCIQQDPGNLFSWNLIDYTLLSDICKWDSFCPPYTYSGLPPPAALSHSKSTKRRLRLSDSPESSDARKLPRLDVPSEDAPGLDVPPDHDTGSDVPSEDVAVHWLLTPPLPSVDLPNTGADIELSTTGVAPPDVPSASGVTLSNTGVTLSNTGVTLSNTGVTLSNTGVGSSATGIAPSSAGAAPPAVAFSLESLGVNPLSLFPPITSVDTSQFDDSQIEMFMELEFRREFTKHDPDLGASHGGLMSTKDKVLSIYNSSLPKLGINPSTITDVRKKAILATVTAALPVHFNQCKTNARYILNGLEADGGYGLTNGGNNAPLAGELLHNESYLYAGGRNRLPGAVKYSHSALRQLPHVTIFGKVYRTKNPLGYTQTMSEIYGDPMLRTTRPDTAIIFSASIFLEDLLLAAGYEKAIVMKGRYERYTYLHRDFHLPVNYNALEPTRKQWLTRYAPGEPRVPLR